MTRAMDLLRPSKRSRYSPPYKPKSLWSGRSLPDPAEATMCLA